MTPVMSDSSQPPSYSGNGKKEAIAACAVALIYLAVSFPGLKRLDTVIMIQQGLSGEVSDCFSPLLIFLFTTIYGIFQNITFIWLTQLALYLYASLFLSRRFGRLSLPLFLVLTLYPPLYSKLEDSYAENWSLACLYIAIALIIDVMNKWNLEKSLKATTFLSLSFACRADDLLVVFPAVIFLALLAWRSGTATDFRKRMLIALAPVALFGALAISIIYIPRALGVRHMDKTAAMMVWDVMGIYTKADVASFSIGDQKIDIREKAPYYTAWSSDDFMWSWSPAILLPGRSSLDWTQAEFDDIRKEWHAAVRKFPELYISHRWNIGRYYFWVRSGYFLNITTFYNLVYDGSVRRDQYEMNQPERHQAVARIFNRDLFDPLWILGYYFIFATILLAATLILKTGSRLLAITLYFMIIGSAAKVVVIPHVMFRYSIWMCVGSILMAFLLLDHFCANRSAEPTAITENNGEEATPCVE